jgi:hypothetical protein
MFIRSPFIFFLTLAFIMTGAWLRGETSAVDAYHKQATDVSQKRFDKKSWSNGQQSDLMQKSFPFKQWDTHYSSLGSKKSNISLTESKEKKRFKSEMVEFDTTEMDISKWDGQLADLERQAQVSTDKTARKIADRRIYESVMQKSKSFAETGEILSLRDINRYQFRSNRSDSAVPVREAGVGGGGS